MTGMFSTGMFANRHAILTVLHVETEEQTLRNARIAADAQTDGVFLVNHDIPADELLSIHRAVVAEHPDWWIGINCLDLTPLQHLQRIHELGLTDTVAGIWVDNAMIDEKSDTQPEAQRFLDLKDEIGWTGLYFGGVAFKYQRPVNDIAQAAIKAAPYMEVVTTSGAGTGEAAAVEKIRQMKAALGEHPLGIASGIAPENVTQYLDYADCFLVATGISKSFQDLDPALVEALVEKVRGYR